VHSTIIWKLMLKLAISVLNRAIIADPSFHDRQEIQQLDIIRIENGDKYKRDKLKKTKAKKRSNSISFREID
jgi:hypothetical protein